MRPRVTVDIAASILVSKVFEDTYVPPYCQSIRSQSEYVSFSSRDLHRYLPKGWEDMRILKLWIQPKKRGPIGKNS
jgi:hypothetical protein